jgi:phosphoglycolate phosphatase
MKIAASNTSILSRPAAVLWDLDGTLIDQTQGIISCFQKVIRTLGFPEPDAHRIRRSLGGPLPESMALFIPSDRVAEAVKHFRAHFPSIMMDGLVLLDGGMACLERLSKMEIPQAILTNKHGPTARQVCESTGISQWTQLCVGNGDTAWSKPEAQLTAHTLESLPLEGSGPVWMIGDSPTDVQTALNADLIPYAVTTGAHSAAELRAAGAADVFESLSELQARLQAFKAVYTNESNN